MLVFAPYSFHEGELNLTPGMQRVHGCRYVFIYTWTNYGTRDLAAVKADIDGLFVDGVPKIETAAEQSYYVAIGGTLCLFIWCRNIVSSLS